MEECRIRAEAFFKEKEERKKAEELIKTQLAAEEAAASKAWTATKPEPEPEPKPRTRTRTRTRTLTPTPTSTPTPTPTPTPTKAWTDTPEAERDVAVLFPGQGTQKVGMAG